MRKWECISVSEPDEEVGLFTVGKIYETNDIGHGMVADNGFTFTHLTPMGKCFFDSFSLGTEFKEVIKN